MNADEGLFRETLMVSIQDGGHQTHGQFWRKFDGDSFFSVILADSDPPDLIAAKALVHFCSDDGEFNFCIDALRAVMRFLEKKYTARSPCTDAEVEVCQRDLATRDFGSVEDLRNWANTHYG